MRDDRGSRTMPRIQARSRAKVCNPLVGRWSLMYKARLLHSWRIRILPPGARRRRKGYELLEQHDGRLVRACFDSRHELLPAIAAYDRQIGLRILEQVSDFASAVVGIDGHA